VHELSAEAEVKQLSKPAFSYAILCPRDLLGAGDEISAHFARMVILMNMCICSSLLQIYTHSVRFCAH